MVKLGKLVGRLAFPLLLGGAILGGYFASSHFRKKDELPRYSTIIAENGTTVENKVLEIDAKSTVVHIRQTHKLNPLLIKSLEEALIEEGISKDVRDKFLTSARTASENTEEVQEEIYRIVENFLNLGYNFTVYLEGTDKDRVDALKEGRKRLDFLWRNHRIGSILPKKDYGEFIESIEPHQFELMEEREGVSGRYEVLHINGKIDLGQTETKESLERAFEHQAKNISSKFQDAESLSNYNHYAFTNRESIVISHLGKGDEKYKVLIFGKAHNFEDDVRRWNANNKDRKMNLYVITPKSIRETKI